MTFTLYCTPFSGLTQKFGATCAARRERDEQVARHVALRKPHLLRPHAIHVEAHLRRVHHLLHVHVRGARNARDLRGRAAAPPRSSAVRVPHHLHVDRRGEADVQHLVHHVGRLEEERDARELLRAARAAACARSPTWSRRGRRLSCDHHVAVARARPSRSSRSRGWCPYCVRPMLSSTSCRSRGGISRRIVRFDAREAAFRLLDARARGRAHVQLELAAVDLREEILPDQPAPAASSAQHERASHDQHRRGDGSSPRRGIAW